MCMLPKEDRISSKSMLDIPLPGIATQGRQNKLKRYVRNSASRYTTQGRQNKLERDVRNSASRYTLPKEDRISYKAMLGILLPGICYPRKTE